MPAYSFLVSGPVPSSAQSFLVSGPVGTPWPRFILSKTTELIAYFRFHTHSVRHNTGRIENTAAMCLSSHCLATFGRSIQIARCNMPLCILYTNKENSGCGLMGCTKVWTCRWLPTLPRKMLLPSSRSITVFLQSVGTYTTIQCHNPDNHNLDNHRCETPKTKRKSIVFIWNTFNKIIQNKVVYPL